MQVDASVQTQSGGNQSPAISQSSTRNLYINTDVTLLFGDTQVREALGVPPDVLLKTVVTREPPPSPSPCLSRTVALLDLAKTFDTNRIAAVIGYPECGKTVAIAEFATSYRRDVFWFSTTHSEQYPDAWLPLFCFALAEYVGADTVLPGDIRSVLVERENALLLVVDNAQHCNDLEALSFLFDAAESNSAISVVLVGTDEPAFVSAVRSRGIVDWRLPGLTDREARSLAELAGGALSVFQLEALEFLRLRVDGHLGMLKLSRSVIRQIETIEQRDAFIRETASALGASLDSLQSAMIERLREGLRDDEVELCRRLSIVVGSFSRRVGEHVWAIDHPIVSFHRPWNRCVVGVFEGRSSGRYALPDLYRDGFRQEASGEAAKAWHGAIADAFEVRKENAADIFDVLAAVIHRFLSGNATAALESASLYLAFPHGPHARAAKAFLVRRFEMWLAGSARDTAVPACQRIRWHAICARVYAELDNRDKEQAAIGELYELLQANPSDASSEAIQLGWSIVLMHASTAGRPNLALAAAEKLAGTPIPIFENGALPYREFMVIYSYLAASESPLSYVRRLMEDRIRKGPPEALWGGMTGYEFWRAVTAAISSRRPGHAPGKEAALQLAGDIGALSANCREVGEVEIACLSQCLLIHIHIDQLRDFREALSVARSTAELANEITDTKVTAYVQDTLGDALRCSDQDEEAVAAYLAAMDIWPVSETPDRAETLFMLGISQAKLGEFRDATRSARQAAKLHLHPNPNIGIEPSDISAARCFLEAAAFSIHGNDYSRSSRCLVAAHELLKDHRDIAEWPALGQIAWSLSNRLKPDLINPQPPVPGFTLGLSDKMPGAENMVSHAPTMMLARACAAVGRPYRAMAYFDTALADPDAPDMRMELSVMALDAAIEAKDLPVATRYAAMGTEWLIHPLVNAPQEKEAFVFDYLVGRTLQLASMHQDEARALAEIDRAIRVLGESLLDNSAIQLLAVTLRAYRAARADGDDSELESAFRVAIERRALWAARDIAWYWCYRFSLGRPAYENQCFLWHWRLCWLSIETAPTDQVYLEGVLAQERTFWARIPQESRSENIRRIFAVLDFADSSPHEAIQKVIAEFSTIACEVFNVTDVSRELGILCHFARGPAVLAESLDALYIRLLELTLHPGAPHVLSTLQGDIACVLDGLRSSTVVITEALEQFEELQALVQVLDIGKPSKKAFQALRRGSTRARELSENSAAQLYTWLRHFVQFSPDDFRFDKITQVLNSEHVHELLQSSDLLPYVRIRLATCYLTAKAFDAQMQLGHALAALGTQQLMRSPIALSAISSAEAARDTALDQLATIVNELQSLEIQARDANLPNEAWHCCLELGGVRRLTGTSLLIQGHHEMARERWLRPSIGDFRRAIEFAKPLDSTDSVELALKAAFAGQCVASALDDQSALAQFVEVINRIRSMGRHDELIAEQELLESGDILKSLDHLRDGSDFLKPDDEGAIQFFTDQIMRSTGWPQDRRRFVEEDARKMARIEQNEHEFCRHMQPLQNLLHTRHPQTVYASPTQYTCSCTLLGHETRIENDDIETVIDAMKRVYCEGCQHRSPGKEQ